MAQQVTCKDCVLEGITSARPANFPGPRCATHHRQVKRKRSERAHGLRVEATYGITAEEYWEIYHSQGGKCYMCQYATGKTKRLAVDHDHDCSFNANHMAGGHDPKVGCRHCVRALVCGPCNEILGRHKPQTLARGITVLTNPPAQLVLKRLAERTSGARVLEFKRR